MKFKLDFQEIKRITAELGRNLYQMVKEAMSLPYAKWYVASAFFLTLIFLVVTFPYGVIVKQQIMKMEGRTFQSVNIAGLNFRLFGISTGSDVSIVTRSGDELSFREVLLEANTIPLMIGALVKNSTRVKGSLALTGMKYAGRTFDCSMNINSNIDMAIDLKSNIPTDGELKLVIQNCKINTEEIHLPPNMGGLSLDLPRITFTSINLNAVVTGRKCTLRNTLFSGPDLRGNITGNIALDRNIQNSRLNLEIAVNADSSLLNSYRELLTKFISPDNMIRIPLKGTLSRPNLDFNALTSPETAL